MEGEYPRWDLIEKMMDIFFFFEIVFIFFTPYFNKNNVLVVSHKKIAIHYIKSKWFWIDTLSIIPFDLMFDFDSNYSVFLKIWKLPRFYKMMKIARLFKSLQQKKKGNSWIVRVKNYLASKSNVLQLIPVFMFIFIMCHCAACMWHFFGWHDSSPDSWVSRNTFRDEPLFDRYVASMYFIFQTITTVGYGDIGVETRVEFAIAIFLMFTGVLFYSNILSELLELIDRKLRQQERIQSRYHLLRTLKTDVKLPNKIIREIMREITGQEEEDEEQVFKPKFPGVIEKDAEELLFEAHRDKFEGIPMFQMKNKKFLIDFSQNMKVVEFTEG